FMNTLLTQSSGYINGDVTVRGSSAKPDINGSLQFNNADFVLVPLGSRFAVDREKITLDNEGFVFNKFAIRDSANNSLTLDGRVYTSNLVNYRFDLDVDARNFQVLNSVKDRDKIYYGRMNVTTNLHIGGTELQPEADGTI